MWGVYLLPEVYDMYLVWVPEFYGYMPDLFCWFWSFLKSGNSHEVNQLFKIGYLFNI